MKDGKSIITEGIHLDPSIYLMDDANKLLSNGQEKFDNAEPSSGSSDNAKRQMKSNLSSYSGSESELNKCSEHVNLEGMPNNMVTRVSDHLEAISITRSALDCKGETVKDPDADKSTSVKNDKSGTNPIIVVPIVLRMAEFDHKALLEEWISSRSCNDKYLKEFSKFKVQSSASVDQGLSTSLLASFSQDDDKLITHLKTMQDYLCSFNSQGLTAVNISATTFPKTLDWLHGHLLQCIEQVISSVPNENGRQVRKDWN